MQTDWFFPRQLAIRLAKREVSNREVANFVLANLLFANVLYYGAFTWANPPWTWLSFYEFVVVVAITVFGMGKCYFAAGGDTNDRFAIDFTCLSFPVWFWSTAVVWAMYWSVAAVIRIGIASFAYQDWQFSRNLAQIGGDFAWLWTFLAIVGAQVLYFWGMHASLLRVANARRAG